MQSWLEGRNWVGKCAQATGMTASLRILSSKADSNTWESFTRSELKLESVHQESPRSDIFRKRATKPLLNQKHRQKHLTWDKEKNNWTVAQWSNVLFSDGSKCIISFGNQGPRVWRKRGDTESTLLEVQCKVSTVSDGLGCHVICWCWSTVFSEVHSQHRRLPGHFRALHASFCWQALWRCWFHFPAGLGTCPHCQRYQKLVQWPWWPWCYCAWLTGKLAWPELHREYMAYCQEEDERHQTQQCRWPEGCYQSILGFITPEQCHGLITFMPRRIAAVIHAKGAQPSIEWIEMNILSEAWHFCLKYPFLLLILCNIQILWDTEFWFFIMCNP